MPPPLCLQSSLPLATTAASWSTSITVCRARCMMPTSWLSCCRAALRPAPAGWLCSTDRRHSCCSSSFWASFRSSGCSTSARALSSSDRSACSSSEQAGYPGTAGQLTGAAGACELSVHEVPTYAAHAMLCQLSTTASEGHGSDCLHQNIEFAVWLCSRLGQWQMAALWQGCLTAHLWSGIRQSQHQADKAGEQLACSSQPVC